MDQTELHFCRLPKHVTNSRQKVLPLANPVPPPLSANRLLAAMPEATLALLDQKWSHVVLPQGTTCVAAGDAIERVYFPTSGVISLVISTEGGKLAEVGMVGREGAVGLQSAYGPRKSFTRAIVQIAGMAHTIAADVLSAAIYRSEQAQSLLIQYTELLWAEAQQLTACNALHKASPRIARLLLQCADRIGSEQVNLTQEFIGEMISVTRTSVSFPLQKLEARRIIKCNRGQITITDRAELQSLRLRVLSKDQKTISSSACWGANKKRRRPSVIR